MEHVALLIAILLVIAGGVLIAYKRSSKHDQVDNNPMRGTTRRSVGK